jgi:transcriptional adapter 2-alpha
MPGRLEFETEWENDAEALIKDMEFGLVHRYGGDDQPTREQALGQTEARTQEETAAMDARQPQAAAPSNRGIGGGMDVGAVLANADAAAAAQMASKGKDADDTGKTEEKPDEQIKAWDETDDDLELKLTIMEMYNERIARRLDAKNFIFERGLLDYKRVSLAMQSV